MARKSKYTTSGNDTKYFHVGAYLRLSREDGDKMESDSIHSQKEIIQKFLERQEDMVLEKTYIDDGVTGTNFNRPKFREMEQDWENKVIDCIIVKDLSRFGRDYIDTGNYLERIFPMKNIRFIAINDGYDNYKQQTSDNLMIPVKNVFNGYYAKDIQTKVNSSLRMKREKGEFIGAFATYGYKKDRHDKHKLVVDEFAAAIVRRIFEEYADGMGQLTIAKRLNDENILCPSEYKASNGLQYRNGNKLYGTTYWTYATIHRILKNQMYLGDMVQGKSYRKVMRGKATMKEEKEWIVVKGTHKPIIDKTLWDKVQRQFSVDTRQDIVEGMQKNVHIFAGLIVCADCKRAMSKNKTRKTLYYVCSTNKRYGKCSRHSIKYDTIYNIILNDLNQCIKCVHNLQKNVEKNKPITEKSNDSLILAIKKADSELGKYQRLKQGLYEDYKSELITKEDYIHYRDDYTSKETALKRELEILEQKKRQKPENLLHSSQWISELLKTKRITKLDRDIALKMIDHIEVSEDNQINITYNFSDELETILHSEYQNK